MANTLLFYIALLKNQRSVLFEISLLSLFLSILPQVFYYLHLFNLHGFSSQHFSVKLEHFPSFLSHYIVKLPCVIFTWEGKIRCLNHMSEDIFSKLDLQPLLIILRENLVYFLWLVHYQFVQCVRQLKQLSSHVVNLHYYGIAHFVRIILNAASLNNFAAKAPLLGDGKQGPMIHYICLIFPVLVKSFSFFAFVRLVDNVREEAQWCRSCG